MKNILYISRIDLDKNSGVEKKIKAQIKAFSNLDANVSYIATREDKIYYCNENEQKYLKECSKNKIIKQMQLIRENIKLIKKLNNID